MRWLAPYPSKLRTSLDPQVCMHRPGPFRHWPTAIVLAFAVSGISNEVRAQSLEPRAYSNAPVGLNFLLTGFKNSRGALELDPTIPIDNASADVDTVVIGYVRSLDVAGNSAKIGSRSKINFSAGGNNFRRVLTYRQKAVWRT